MADGRRHACDNPRKNNQRNTITDASLCDLLSQPHDEGGACRQGQHGHETKMPARIWYDERPTHFHMLQTNSNTQALYHTQYDCAITGILIDFLPPCLPFFLELFQIRDNHREQLKNNGCADIRHNPKGKDRHLLERAPGEHIEEAENGSTHTLEIVCQCLAINTWGRYKGPHPIYSQKDEGIEETLFQFGDFKNILDPIDHVACSSAVPPATIIFCLAT